MWKSRFWLAILVGSISTCLQINAAIYTVVNTNDSGGGSLRDAITNANTNGDQIHFNIPGSAPHVITLLSNLPTISHQIVIDGYTQPDSVVNTAIDRTSNAIPTIVISGNDLTATVGLHLIAGSEGTVISGLVINDVFGNAVFCSNLGGNIIKGCFLGTDFTGEVLTRNTAAIRISAGCNGNIVGGANAADRNVIAGVIYTFSNRSVFIQSNNNIVRNNLIGVNKAGNRALGDTGIGVGITAGSSNLIDHNVISGCSYSGILFRNASDNVITGNFIGVDASGKESIPNGTGIVIRGNGYTFTNNNIVGGTLSTDTNVISGNTTNGLQIVNDSMPITQGPNVINTQVINNIIGLDVTGTFALGNGQNGILEGANQTQIIDNIVSSNGQNGIEISEGSIQAYVSNNVIGSDKSQYLSLGNDEDGIRIGKVQSPASLALVEGNFIGFNGGAGVRIFNSEDNTIINNIFKGNKSRCIEICLSRFNTVENNTGCKDSST